MTKIDGGLRDLFRTKLRQGFHWQAVETGGTGLGIPDSNFCCDFTEGWIEYKQTEGWSVGLRPEQIGWIHRRWRAGGKVWVATRRWHDGGPRRGDPVDQLWITPGGVVRELGSGGLRAVEEDSTVLEGGPSRWDWERVRGLLLAE